MNMLHQGIKSLAILIGWEHFICSRITPHDATKCIIFSAVLSRNYRKRSISRLVKFYHDLNQIRYEIKNFKSSLTGIFSRVKPHYQDAEDHGVKYINFLLFILLFQSISIFSQNANLPNLKPKEFESKNVSTLAVEYSSSFSFSGNELYFARSNDKWGQGSIKSSIYYSVKENGKWSIPKIASFSGNYDDSDPHLTKDGKALYFISKRPSDVGGSSADIWVALKDKTGKWGTPVKLDKHVNSEWNEYSPRTDGNGDLYFASDRPGGYGQGDLYVARKENDKFAAPINFGNALNTNKGEWNLEINGKGDLIIFEASQRKGNLSPYGDLYISFKLDNRWTIPQNISELNTTGSDLYAELVNNQQTLYFTSSDSLKSTSTDIYSVPFDPLYEKYKEQAILPEQYLLVVNRSSHGVSVISLSTGKIIKTIPTGIGPHEISVSKDNKYAFVANYGSYPKPHDKPISSKELKWIDDPQSTITKINLTDYKTLTFSIPESLSYHGILTNSDGSLIWITDENEGVVRELDGNTGNVLNEYTTMPGSHILKSTNDFSKLFVSNIESNTLSVIDLNTHSVIQIPTPKGPEGMEISPDGKFLWVLCNTDNKVMIVNTESLEITNMFDAAGKFPVKLTFINNEVWVVNVFSKNLSVFNALTTELKTQIPLETTPLGITSNNNKVYITLPRKNMIRIYDCLTKKVVGEYSAGIEPDGLSIINDVEQIITE